MDQFRTMAWALGFCLALQGINLASAETKPNTLPKSKDASASQAPTWKNVNSFLYQLQKQNTKAMGSAKYQLIITDPAKDGANNLSTFTRSDIQALKNGPGGPKLVLAYISIGEAEDYRSYWRNEWDANHDGKPDKGAPTWLGPAIYSQWPGNYTVKYWDPEWQAIMAKKLDQIIEAGFDGVYLDRVDTYEYWSPDGASALHRASAEDEMVDYVKKIANYVRTKSGRKDFGVFPQGGFALAEHPDYLSVCTGIGNEDNWYSDNDRNDQQDTNETLAYLDRFKKAGKLVLVTDYVTRPSLIDDFYKKAQAKGYVPFATTRTLDKLTTNKGHEPK
jgi:cysteinyl-tRNA synthetase